MSYAADREQFISTMVKEGMPIETARLILRDAATIQRVCEHECNGTATIADRARRKYARVRISSRTKPPFGFVYNDDPRGACVKITVPSGRTDDWGQTGICVPTRD